MWYTENRGKGTLVMEFWSDPQSFNRTLFVRKKDTTQDVITRIDDAISMLEALSYILKERALRDQEIRVLAHYGIDPERFLCLDQTGQAALAEYLINQLSLERVHAVRSVVTDHYAEILKI